MSPNEVTALARATFREWKDDNAARLGAALAFYSVFSLAPLLVIVISISGLLFGREAVEGRVANEIEGLVGPDAAQSIQALIENARKPAPSILSGAAGFAALLLGASGVFVELQSALNTVWDVPPQSGGTISDLIRDRFLSFAMVVGIGFLLLISLVMSAAVAAFNDTLSSIAAVPAPIVQVAHLVLAFLLTTVMFALIFKVLPDVTVAWRDAWIGAAITSTFFTIGKVLIGLYLGTSSLASTYGAAASVVIVLLWVYYSSQILFIGAEFTQVYASRRMEAAHAEYVAAA